DEGLAQSWPKALNLTPQVEGGAVSAEGSVAIAAHEGSGSLTLRGVAAGVAKLILSDQVSGVKSTPTTAQGLQIVNDAQRPDAQKLKELIERLSADGAPERAAAEAELQDILTQFPNLSADLENALPDQLPEGQERIRKLLDALPSSL